MLIQTLLPPVAGETLRFKVAGCSGRTKIEVFAGAEKLLEQEHTGLLCNLAVEVPNGTGGQSLRICAADESGAPKSVEYEISETDPGPHSMLSGVRRNWNTPPHTRRTS